MLSWTSSTYVSHERKEGNGVVEENRLWGTRDTEIDRQIAIDTGREKQCERTIILMEPWTPARVIDST